MNYQFVANHSRIVIDIRNANNFMVDGTPAGGLETLGEVRIAWPACEVQLTTESARGVAKC